MLDRFSHCGGFQDKDYSPATAIKDPEKDTDHNNPMTRLNTLENWFLMRIHSRVPLEGLYIQAIGWPVI